MQEIVEKYPKEENGNTHRYRDAQEKKEAFWNAPFATTARFIASVGRDAFGKDRNYVGSNNDTETSKKLNTVAPILQVDSIVNTTAAIVGGLGALASGFGVQALVGVGGTILANRQRMKAFKKASGLAFLALTGVASTWVSISSIGVPFTAKSGFDKSETAINYAKHSILQGGNLRAQKEFEKSAQKAADSKYQLQEPLKLFDPIKKITQPIADSTDEEKVTKFLGFSVLTEALEKRYTGEFSLKTPPELRIVSRNEEEVEGPAANVIEALIYLTGGQIYKPSPYVGYTEIEPSQGITFRASENGRSLIPVQNTLNQHGILVKTNRSQEPVYSIKGYENLVNNYDLEELLLLREKLNAVYGNGDAINSVKEIPNKIRERFLSKQENKMVNKAIREGGDVETVAVQRTSSTGETYLDSTNKPIVATLSNSAEYENFVQSVSKLTALIILKQNLDDYNEGIEKVEGLGFENFDNPLNSVVKPVAYAAKTGDLASILFNTDDLGNLMGKSAAWVSLLVSAVCASKLLLDQGILEKIKQSNNPDHQYDARQHIGNILLDICVNAERGSQLTREETDLMTSILTNWKSGDQSVPQYLSANCPQVSYEDAIKISDRFESLIKTLHNDVVKYLKTDGKIDNMEAEIASVKKQNEKEDFLEKLQKKAVEYKKKKLGVSDTQGEIVSSEFIAWADECMVEYTRALKDLNQNRRDLEYYTTISIREKHTDTEKTEIRVSEMSKQIYQNKLETLRKQINEASSSGSDSSGNDQTGQYTLSEEETKKAFKLGATTEELQDINCVVPKNLVRPGLNRLCRVGNQYYAVEANLGRPTADKDGKYNIRKVQPEVFQKSGSLTLSKYVPETIDHDDGSVEEPKTVSESSLKALEQIGKTKIKLNSQYTSGLINAMNATPVDSPPDQAIKPQLTELGDKGIYILSTQDLDAKPYTYKGSANKANVIIVSSEGKPLTVPLEAYPKCQEKLTSPKSNSTRIEREIAEATIGSAKDPDEAKQLYSRLERNNPKSQESIKAGAKAYYVKTFNNDCVSDDDNKIDHERMLSQYKSFKPDEDHPLIEILDEAIKQIIEDSYDNTADYEFVSNYMRDYNGSIENLLKDGGKLLRDALGNNNNSFNEFGVNVFDQGNTLG
jgi:hypothetical protein